MTDTLPPKDMPAADVLRWLADYCTGKPTITPRELRALAGRIEDGVPAVRGQELTASTVLVEGMGVADSEGGPWWWLNGRWRYALSTLTDDPGPGLSTEKLLIGDHLLITYVPEGAS